MLIAITPVSEIRHGDDDTSNAVSEISMYMAMKCTMDT